MPSPLLYSVSDKQVTGPVQIQGDEIILKDDSLGHLRVVCHTCYGKGIIRERERS